MKGMILAGGRGHRMGDRAKPWIPLAGRPILEYLVDGLRSVADEIILVAKEGDAIGPLPDGITARFESHPIRSALVGLLAALRFAQPGPTIVVGCDMPFLQSNALRRVIRSLKDADAAVPVVGGRWQPLHAAYNPTPAVLEHLQTSIDAGRLGVVSAIEGLAVRLLPEEEFSNSPAEMASFDNINRPEDLERALRRLSGPSSG